MSTPFVPIKTAVLSWYHDLPFSIQYNDVYHSFASGIAQSRYVFIDGNNLLPRWRSLSSNTKFVIAEIGFGTGLNFLLSWRLWEENALESCRLHFISCEKHPLTREDLIKSLHVWPQLKKQAQQLIASYPVLTPGYHHLVFCNGRVTLTLMLGDALDCYEQLLICGDFRLEQELRTSFVDAWYLDGFAPAKNKSMWSDSLINIVALLSKKGTTLATYTAAGIVKESLRQHGFTVEKKKGFGPKRHMISAYFHSSTALQNARRRHTPWHVGEAEKYSNKSAVIIGAGLAGCFTAYALAKKGWKVTLIDECNEVGKGASANQQAILFPKLSAYNSPLTQLMLSSFLYASQLYQSILQQVNIGELNGALLLATSLKEQLAQSSLRDWLAQYPALGSLVNSKQATALAGLPLEQDGLFIPLSGWINSPALCQLLINTEGISLITNTSIKQLFFDKKWIINQWETEVLILANGYKITSFKEAEYLPIKPIRGQMTTILSTEESSALKRPLCASGHVLPSLNGVHHIGATYELKISESTIKNEDNWVNWEKLGKLAPDVLWSDQIVGHWAGIRATTPDYLPIVGRVANQSAFMDLYSGLASNSKRWIAKAGPYYPGLYACSGFGSRGLTTIPLCAEWLACLINEEPNFLPRILQQALSPARFLRKSIISKKA
ncbi:bifunctional tRNA (5-methylaminomethyl-2-thiouridine)(34)-methyltransferase MnmD/FAD-dependent 5-carboxymethylaminomethyl-2-thiouridine(34) oxidoreductase MnmC [Legionella sp.]|uniref:bifunctional tRNA (5-methylaminomethyl-2-thiouridine)(34)-methyltransferase MnmD/FAD-dependent 5-carboxymethylaminomethyl-2-thiouridine(34) oxidoreductase MnmC n=1 Tax=Legionella sp. TaxID=459 RepID=UPI003CA40980